MIFKLIGSIIIFTSLTCLGIFLARSKIDRVKQLNNFISALNMLEIEIKFAYSLLPDAFIKIAEVMDQRVGEIFLYVSSQIEEFRVTASEAWIEAIESRFGVLSLTGEDKETLLALGSSLGETDGESQIKNIRLIAERLKGQLTKAEEEKLKSEKLFRNMGILTGLAVVIILY